MTPLARFEVTLLLIAVAVGLELVARRLRVPPAAAFIIGGIGLALIPGSPGIELDPELALVLFLPPLLLASAYFTAWRDFRSDMRSILQLAVGAVIFTTLVVGWVAHLVMPTLPWAACFALGAIVSPPDAVSAKAVLQGLPLPRRVIVLLEGESLVNDASGLVLFRFAVAAALTGLFDPWQATLSFATLAAGGIAAGVAFGFAAGVLLGWLREPALGILGSFLAAWGSYIGAEALGVSGVLSTVACGLVLGWRQHVVLPAATRLQARAVWDVVVFVLESSVFILIGLSLRGVLERLGHASGSAVGLLPAVSAVVLAVIVSRAAWIFPATYLPRLLPRVRRRGPRPLVAVPIVMAWAGMRGVVSLAAALTLPDGFPGRDFILVTTFAVILVTVLVQGTTLAPLIRALPMGAQDHRPAGTLHVDEARARMTTAQARAVSERSLRPDGTQIHPRLVEQYAYRERAATRFSEAADDLAHHRRAHFDVVLAAVAAGRAELLGLHRRGDIHDSVLHVLEHELDIEEMGARRFNAEEA